MRSKLHPRFWPAAAAAILTLFICLLLYFRFPAGPLPQTVPGDFSVYLKATERALAGHSPYVASDPSPYRYAPGVLFLFGLLPNDPIQAWYWFGTISVVLLGISLFVSGTYSNWKSVVWLGIGLLMGWKGLLENFDYGQLEVLILALSLIAAALLSRAAFVAGLIAGLLPWLKLPWILLLLPFMTAATLRTERRGRLFFSGYMTSCVAWGAAVPSLMFGSDRAKEMMQAWIGILRGQPSPLYFSDMNQSIWMSIVRWFGPESIQALGLGALILGLLLGLMMARASDAGIFRRTPALAWISPWLVLTQLMSPLSWRWGSVFVIGMPMAAGWGVVRKPEDDIPFDVERIHRNLRFSVAAMVMMLFLLQQNPVAHQLGFGHWTDFHSAGVVTAFWLSWLVMVLV